MEAGVFEFIAADQEQPRLAARQALLIAESRVEAQFGTFLRLAHTAQDYDARFDLVKDRFIVIVAEACDEVGHPNASNIAQTIYESHRPRLAEEEAPEEDEDDAVIEFKSTPGRTFDPKTKKFKSAALGETDPTQVEFAPTTPTDPASLDPNYQMGTPPVAHGSTPAGGGGAPSSLNHQGIQALQMAQQIQQAVMNGQIHSPQDVQRLVNMGSLTWEPQDIRRIRKTEAAASDSHTAAPKGEGNTGLSGPSPKMDKRLWTPENVKPITEGVGKAKEMDVMAPIVRKNDDPLEDIGDAKSEKLPTAEGLDGGGFADGGVEKGPHTNTWGNDGQTKPVTHEIQD